MKTVPIAKEKAFIKLDKAFKSLELEHQLAKAEMLKYHEKGYAFTLLKLSDTTKGVFAPPWKKLCMQLLKKFMPLSQRKAWLLSLHKKYPPKERAPRFIVLAKE